MARAATTSDPFNAVAEPRRRQILTFLAADERDVSEIVIAVGLDQPSVSKHRGVLRRVGLVRVRRNGRHRLYRTNAEALKPMHEWTETFERFWRHQLNRVKERAEAHVNSGLASQQPGSTNPKFPKEDV
jgi:DNA-binding transcriptional ArsR family regulator